MALHCGRCDKLYENEVLVNALLMALLENADPNDAGARAIVHRLTEFKLMIDTGEPPGGFLVEDFITLSGFHCPECGNEDLERHDEGGSSVASQRGELPSAIEILEQIEADLSSVDIEKADTDFAQPEQWEKMAFNKMYLGGRFQGRELYLGWEEKSGRAGMINQGHYGGAVICLGGFSFAAGADEWNLGDTPRFPKVWHKDAASQSLVYEVAPLFRRIMTQYVATHEPQWLRNATLNNERLAALPWGESAMSAHDGPPPREGAPVTIQALQQQSMQSKGSSNLPVPASDGCGCTLAALALAFVAACLVGFSIL